jgi:hypothetical protein
MKRSVLRWELIGILAISIVGSMLHFVFEWSGGSPLVGVFGAVNESVWEHFKIAFWPTAVYALVEYPFLKNSASNFALAKAAGLYVIPATIALVFYTYTTITGTEILAVDIATFVVAIAVGQLVSYRILKARQAPAWLNRFSLTMIILLALAFVLFTFFPPHLPIFRDSVSGTYGIP